MSPKKGPLTDAQRQQVASANAAQAARRLRAAAEILDGLGWSAQLKQLAEDAEHVAERLKQYAENKW